MIKTYYFHVSTTVTYFIDILNDSCCKQITICSYTDIPCDISHSVGPRYQKKKKKDV